MLSFEQIYDSIPFEDEQGLSIPHDKFAKMVAEKYIKQYTAFVLSKMSASVKDKCYLQPNEINKIHSNALRFLLKSFGS